MQRASRLAEARFFYLSAIRELGDHEQYVALARALVAEFPESSWAEETLNNLGTHYIVTNDDEAAAATFREQYAKFPRGLHAERAAWKCGWWTYTTGDYAETVRVFESAAAAFARSNYRPSWLYWAGRAHGKLGAAAERLSRMRLVMRRLREFLLRSPCRGASALLRRAAVARCGPACRLIPTRRTRTGATDRPDHPPVAGGRAMRRRDQRAALRAAGMKLLRDRSNHGVGVPPGG